MPAQIRTTRARHMTMLVVLFAVSLATLMAAGATAATESHARVLKDKKTGLTVKAPKGYKIKQRKGAYKVYKRGKWVKFIRVKSRLKNAKAVAVSQMRAGKGKRKKQKSYRKGKEHRIIYKRGKRFEQVIVKRVRKNVYDVITLKADNPARKNNLRSAGASGGKQYRITAAQVALLSGIATSRRRGPIVLLNTNVPTRRCTGGGATARVPNLRGWRCTPGTGGEMFGAHPTQGFYHLGGISSFTTIGVSNVFRTVRTAMNDGTFRNYLAAAGGRNPVVRVVSPVPGTVGWLGPAYTSEMYRVRATINGRSYDLLTVVGTTDIGGSGVMVMYVSMIGILSNNQVPGLGPAIFNAWTSWDNSVATNKRLQQIANTINTTPFPKGPIDPAAFERSFQLWNEYLRM